MFEDKISPVSGNTPLTQNTSEEQLVGIIPEVYKRKVLGGKEAFRILVTEKHLMFIPTALLKPVRKQVNPLKIEISQVKSVLINPGRGYYDCCRKFQEEDGRLDIMTTDKLYTFYLPRLRVSKAKQLLSGVNLLLKEGN